MVNNIISDFFLRRSVAVPRVPGDTNGPSTMQEEPRTPERVPIHSPIQIPTGWNFLKNTGEDSTRFESQVAGSVIITPQRFIR